jgi:hypothetical protein
MSYLQRYGLVVIALVLLALSDLRAQTTVDPSGHWEGTIQLPGRALNVIFDFTKDNGRLVGTMTNHAERIVGLPFNSILMEGDTITFGGRSDQPIIGVLARDGRSMEGTAMLGGYSLPFGANRTGEARMLPLPQSAAVNKQLEGIWTGNAVANGQAAEVVLAITNQPDGTARASLAIVNEGGLTIPMVVTQVASTVSLQTSIMAISFSGELDVTGIELVGTIIQGTISVPVRFQRMAGS